MLLKKNKIQNRIAVKKCREKRSLKLASEREKLSVPVGFQLPSFYIPH
jgi:hypothetical protein